MKSVVTAAAMRLPPRSRVRLAARLLDSLGTTSRRQVDKLWAVEAESRIAAFKAGRMKAVPAEAMLAYR